MKPVTYWARGERNIGGALPLIVLTNCDAVEFGYGGALAKRIAPDREAYPHLPHAPVVIDHRHFSPDELGLWGELGRPSPRGLIGDRVVAEVRMVADPVAARLGSWPTTTGSLASEKDAVRVIVRALDQAGSLLPFLRDPVTVRATGRCG